MIIIIIIIIRQTNPPRTKKRKKKKGNNLPKLASFRATPPKIKPLSVGPSPRESLHFTKP
jgi:hypothetical protein